MKNILFSFVAFIGLYSCSKYNKIYSHLISKVETVSIADNVISSDGLTTDKLGNVYATNNIGTSTDPFNGNGTTVYKITPRGLRTLFADSLGGPAGCCFDKWDNFFVCTFRDGKLIKIKSNGVKQVFAEGLEGPIQVVSDKQGNLFVTVAGYGENAGTKIYKFTPNGIKTTFVDLFSFGGISLSGMAIDKNDNLYVANYANGKLLKVTPQAVASLFVDFSTGSVPYTSFTSYLTYANNNIYATGLFANRIYKVTMAGKVSVLAGTGVSGSQDGSPTTATFNGPNGIVAEPYGNVLYISESNSKKLRRIVAFKKL
jgi:sugar lactone lactonase YvrE